MEQLEERVRALEIQVAVWKGAFVVAAIVILGWVGVTAWVSLPREVNKQLSEKIGSDTMRRVEQFNIDAEAALQRLQNEQAYVRYDQQVTLFPGGGSSEALAGWISGGGTGVRPYKSNDSAFKWAVRRPQ